MLHCIKVSNYQSIREEIALDFRVPGTTPEKDWLRSPTSDPAIRIPAVIVFVGPNGSGKTACLRALEDSIRFAANSYTYKEGPIPGFSAFASEETFSKSTRVEVQFDAAWLTGPAETNRVFQYTLELQRSGQSPNPDTVGYEAIHFFPRGRPRRLMERRGREPVFVAKEMAIRKNDDRLANVPSNASVLSCLSRMGIKSAVGVVESLQQVQMNVSVMDPIRVSSDTIVDFYHSNPQVIDSMSEKVGRVDLGIEEMELVQLGNGKWYLFFSHSGLEWQIPLESESAGTRRIVNVFPALYHALENGGLALMDALDNDLHAKLLDEILSWFRRHDTNPSDAQLICSLHSQSALEQLEKEEIFIFEKGYEGGTRAYGVRDVKGVRRSENLRKLYGGGVLGGLPAIG